MEKGENLNRRKMPGQYCTGQPLSEKLLRKRTSYRRLSVYKRRAGMD